MNLLDRLLNLYVLVSDDNNHERENLQ